jgi:type VI secretion system protein VasD
LASVAIPYVAGCSSAPKPTVISGSVQASTGLNPSVSQRPSPLLVRVYELKSAAAFSAADFMSLHQSDQTALGADLVAKEEMMLQPGETRPYEKRLADQTRFVGVFAAYRNLEQATWRAISPVQPNRSQTITIRAEPLAVSVTISP